MSRRRSVASARRKVIGVTYSYDFAGTSGAWASPWVAVSGTVDIQSGKGRTETAAVAYESAVSHYNAVMPGDCEILVHPTITTVTAAEFYGIINVRAGSNTFTDIRQHSSWNLRFYGSVGVGLCELYRVDASGAYSPTALASGSDIDFVQGSVLHVRVRVVGGNIKVRYWKSAETEPSTWQIDFDDPTAPMGTSMSLAIRNGADAVADRWDWDDFSFVSIVSGPASGTVARTLGNVTVAASGTGSSTAFDAPVASAISGMSATPYKDYDWASDTVNPTGGGDNGNGSFNGTVSDWVIVNWADVQNNEKSAPRTANVTIENDATASGGKLLRLAVKQESWIGFAYSGVQMENFYAGPDPGRGNVGNIHKGYGQDSPFFFECRLRWTGYDGFWGGPWAYDLDPPSTPAEADFMETVNNAAARYALHSPNSGPTTYAGAGTPDGQWHRYGMRFHPSEGVKVYYDNVLVETIANPSLGAAFANANMGLKLQHFCGGNYPDGEAGHTTPQGVTFPKYFDVDWIRIYRPGSGGTTWNVPAQGTLQQVADVAQPGDTIMVSGVNSYSGKILHLNNRDNGANPITIIGNSGNILRGTESGIEGYGSNRGWTFQDLNIEVHGGNNAPFGSNSARYGEGIYFAGERADQGGDGQGCTNIRVIGCTIRPIAGTGTVQRSGVSIWGCDGLIEVGDCDISDVGYNDNGFFGGAASGISIGRSIRHAATPDFANGARVWIHGNKVRNVIGPGTSSADRNALIVDLFHGGTNGVFYTNRSIGKILIEGNDFANCEGRGVQILCAGAADSQVEITANLVRAPMATNLGGSEPIAGIGGYGIGVCGNVVCNNNDVTVSSGASAYSFFDFNGAMDASISGVRGSGNVGEPRNFSGSAPGF